MLERQGLVLSNWKGHTQWPATARLPGVAPDLLRSIHDLATRQFLGFVASTNLSRPRLLSRSALEVYETEDASLLMTVYRPWLFSWTWDVYDAEERHIGMVHRGNLYDGAANRLGRLNLSGAGERGVFSDAHGITLAILEIRDEETQLSFCPAVDGQPFVRMVLLAATLGLSDRLLLNHRRAVVLRPATGAQPC